MTRPSPFDFTSSREYLFQAYADRKARWDKFSHRYVAQKTGTSSGYLSRLLNGSLHLSQDRIPAFGKLFELNTTEVEYLSQLVACEEAIGPQKVLEFRKLLELRGIQLRYIEDDQFGIYSAWYFPVLREVLALAPIELNDEELGALLHPPLEAEQIAKSKARLVELGLLRLENNRYVRAERIIASGESPHLGLRHYADECLALARRALSEEPLIDRELSFLTLSVSEKSRELVLQRVRELRRELLDLAAAEPKPDRVIQVQLHLLPMASPWKQDSQPSEPDV
jgi:uncharacterized protein (TIGR02147 family)